ncbi:unnamed protein product [Rhizoctonia solani]|uniref:Ribosome production factor 1 n=1 Tax=Rhizoctonia solani TaxID=456999 RepID=A0A8H3D0S3_9AGAM|nr:unnamed protein product [Rhizoctonia solani]
MPPTRFEPSSIKNKIKREDVHHASRKSKAQEKLRRRLALTRFEPSSIKNKIKREDVHHASRKSKAQEKLRRRLALKEAERKDPSLKKKRVSENVPRTLDNTREFNPTIIPVGAASIQSKEVTDEAGAENTEVEQPTSGQMDAENTEDIANDVFAEHFDSNAANFDPTKGPKVLITTSQRATKASFQFCEELTTAQISGHARPSPHYPELVLNGFVTRLGITVGRLFQTLFPVMPEFEGRQVVTLHNQRDFLFFRRHRYAFRSAEKAALQEIGPRFTLKLRSLKKGLPVVETLSNPPPALEFASEEEGTTNQDPENGTSDAHRKTRQVPNVSNDFEWVWKEVHSGHRVTRTRGPSEGKFTFTSHESGDHSICLSTNYTSGWFSSTHIRMYLDINVGAAKPNVEHDRDHVTEMADKIRELNHKLAEIRREQQYQREREADFRDLSEATNSRAVWYIIAQIIVLLVTCAWQLRHLKHFFEDHKL